MDSDKSYICENNITLIKNLLSVILVDDESFAIANLTKLIETYCPSLKIVSTASNVLLAEQRINYFKPDVVFLDINMPNLNGFELLDRLIDIPLVVFVTAHEKHAIMAMKVNAVDFLLKPISIPELINTQKKLLQIHSIKPEIKKNYGNVLRNLGALMEKKESIRKLTVHGINGYEIYNMDDILYLAGEDNYTSFHFLNRKSIMVSKTLKEYETFLQSFGFMRIHKSTIVNLKYVNRIVQTDGPKAILMNETGLDVSRRKLPALVEWCKGRLN